MPVNQSLSFSISAAPSAADKFCSAFIFSLINSAMAFFVRFSSLVSFFSTSRFKSQFAFLKLRHEVTSGGLGAVQYDTVELIFIC